MRARAPRSPADLAFFQPIRCVNCGSDAACHQTLVSTQVTHLGQLHGQPLRIVVCAQCGLTFLNPQPTTAALKHFYAREYYSPKKEVNPQKRMKEKEWQRDILFAWLEERLGPICNWFVFDIGCGYGEFLRHFDKSNCLAGIELSEAAARIANESFGVQVRQCDFMENSCANDSFDLITGLAIIEHFLDPLAALVEINRLTKSGGYAFLQTPDLHGLVLRKGIPRFFKLVHTHYFTLGTLSSLFQKAGFEIAAARRRPAVLSTSDLLRPGNFWAGELDILARKRQPVTLAQAQKAQWAGDKPGETMALVKTAIARDSAYSKLQQFYQLPLLGKLANHAVRLGYTISGRSTKRANFHTRQLEMLQAKTGAAAPDDHGPAL